MLEGLDDSLAVQHEGRDIPFRKRRRVRVSSGASPGEPRTHPSSISPPMVWVANGRPSWRLWMPTTTPSSPSPPPAATARDEFAKLWAAQEAHAAADGQVEGGAEGEAKGAVHAWDRPGAGYTQRLKKYMNAEISCGAISTDAEWDLILSRAKLGTFMLPTLTFMLHSDTMKDHRGGDKLYHLAHC